MDIGNILSGLSSDDMDRLKELAGQLSQGGGGEAAENALPLITGADSQLLGSIAKFSSAFSEHDDRSDFLMALKPLLSEGRRTKADEAVKMLKLLKMISMLKENGI